MSRKQNECVFCNIVSNTSGSYVVFEDDYSVSFLDRRPLFPGHCLLIPKQHLATVDDLDENTRDRIFKNMQVVNKAVETAMNAEGTFVAINNKVSQSVPHMHIHVVPRNKKDGLRGFFWPRNPYRDEEHIKEVRSRITRAVNEIARR